MLNLLNERSKKLFTDAKRVIPGGVNSPVRAFKSVGGLDQIKSVKELIVKDRLTDEDPDDYYLRHIDGGLFEIRREVDFSPVYGDDDQPLIFYPKDLQEIIKTIEKKQREEAEAKVKKLQEVKIKSKEEQQELETVLSGIQGS